MKKSKYIWFNDKFVQWDKATTHVLSHGLHYGSGIFEGIRAYSNRKNTFIFRLSDHYTRFFNSAKVAFIKIPYSQKKLDIFEGPLDLLLSLIRDKDLDIYEISLTQVTQQYLEYVDLLKQINFQKRRFKE